jgi:hypothetical protein
LKVSDCIQLLADATKRAHDGCGEIDLTERYAMRAGWRSRGRRDEDVGCKGADCLTGSRRTFICIAKLLCGAIVAFGQELG